ncbi:MAG TPA: surface-adhesin E family protein [Pyrinomonadaceae bacterium]|nr:surface-adhesin E family protein [Pyrinomonadaceae bacterium]
MRKTLAALALILAPTTLNAQEKREWYRVYTFEESVIEMNTQLVSFSGKSTGRVRFRWSFEKPQRWGAKGGVEYRSRLEVVEFDCKEKRYRHSALTLFDASGRTVHAEEMDWFGPWTPVAYQSFTNRLYEPACRLLEVRRNPSKSPPPAEPAEAEMPATAGSLPPAEPARVRPRLKKRSAPAPRQ